MTGFKTIKILSVIALSSTLCFAADNKKDAKQAATPPSVSGAFFSTNVAAGSAKGAPFSAEISADFIKKVMETSARIEECKKQIAERQAYLYESNPKIKAMRSELIDMQKKINEILNSDKDLADLRMNRDILWTTMPVLPKPPREQQMGMRGQIGK